MDLALLEGRLGHRFHNPALLRQALCHRSHANENPAAGPSDNERLEFLGDAVLGLCVGMLLMRRFEDTPEGDLSRMRATLVNETSLASMARSLDLGAHLLLGKGEALCGGADKNSILADTLEAVFAAVFLDAGYETASAVVDVLFSPLVPEPGGSLQKEDYKSRLQEEVQVKTRTVPQYQVAWESGPDHDKTFTARVTVGEREALGTGRSKKAAEQDAARAMLDTLAAEEGGQDG
jgi:ribonuclease III